ncbi:Hemerythrin HHE cation binding domain-containing protein [Candidatus Methylobacter favarea]|uniref:Hemerythrin HHE cation binding domain-containing protein n=1 Tax=Candidatus Methylobacter favarea TaxID=2707345 RepID=A0A8S0YAF3_9GAMM|nr:hemerythrin domain-containing protein [Candidatus Methylobacter favarea]CAA9891765.1 Hemerythrin HHE cation binding domain-containing protein [Candidatus Methylobacter favarea]
MTTTSKAKPETNAIDLLTTDHKKVKNLFKEYEKLKDGEDTETKKAVAIEICNELTVHAKVEEELFYPAARKAIGDDDLINEANVEHATAKDLIAQIQSMDVEDPMYDAKVKVLGEYVNHHVGEEQNEIFTKVKKAKFDTDALGAEIAELKEMLMTKMLKKKNKTQEH